MAWALRRIGISLVLIWVVASVVFLSIHLVPGDPAELLLSQGGAAPDPAVVADLHAQLGLDRPLGARRRLRGAGARSRAASAAVVDARADDRAGARSRGVPYDPGGGARRHAARLRAHGAGQGRRPAPGDAAPCRAHRADAGG